MVFFRLKTLEGIATNLAAVILGFSTLHYEVSAKYLFTNFTPKGMTSTLVIFIGEKL